MFLYAVNRGMAHSERLETTGRGRVTARRTGRILRIRIEAGEAGLRLRRQVRPALRFDDRIEDGKACRLCSRLQLLICCNDYDRVAVAHEELSQEQCRS